MFELLNAGGIFMYGTLAISIATVAIAIQRIYTLWLKLRMPAGEWPDPAQRGLDHINPAIYVPLQGPSELGLGGKLLEWDRTADLTQISVPTLVIGAEHDTMDPRHMEWMATAVQRGRSVICPSGSHMAMYDDYDTYRTGLIDFIYDVDSGAFA